MEKIKGYSAIPHGLPYFLSDSFVKTRTALPAACHAWECHAELVAS